MTQIRKLYASEIECRVSQCKKGQYGVWCDLLLYKDARVDMRILDEVYGPMNWQREHTLIGGRLYCTIKIYDSEKKEWICKQDVGTESNAEPEKGQASDAFKRAGFNVGIGRELYTAPTIRVYLNEGEYRVDTRNGKEVVTPRISFDVKDISYDGDGTIRSVTIVDNKGAVRFPKQSQSSAQPAAQAQAPAQQPKRKQTMDQNHKGWSAMCDAVVAGKYTINQIAEMYDLPNYAEAALKEYVMSKQG